MTLRSAAWAIPLIAAWTFSMAITDSTASTTRKATAEISTSTLPRRMMPWNWIGFAPRFAANLEPINDRKDDGQLRGPYTYHLAEGGATPPSGTGPHHSIQQPQSTRVIMEEHHNQDDQSFHSMVPSEMSII